MWSQDIECDLNTQAAELEVLASEDTPQPQAKAKWAHLVTTLVILALTIGGPFTAEGTWTCGQNNWGGCR